MDNLTKKKWFLYINERHEGPYNATEIQEKIAHGIITQNELIWSEGLEQWLPLNAAHELQAQLQKSATLSELATSISEASGPSVEDYVAPGYSPEHSNGGESLSSTYLKAAVLDLHYLETPQADRVQLETPQKPAPQPNLEFEESTLEVGLSDPSFAQEMVHEQALENAQIKENRKKLSQFLLPTGALILVTLSSIYTFQAIKSHNLTEWKHSQLLKLTNQFVFLKPWIFPLPQLNDVSPEDTLALKEAAYADPKISPRFALAPSQADGSRPFFYIASNLPDGANLQLTLKGISNTLINQFSFETQTNVVLQGALAQSSKILRADGKAIPQGEYFAYLTLSGPQPQAVLPFLDYLPSVRVDKPSSLQRGARVIAYGRYFLNGTNDVAYQEKLQSYHKDLRARALAEIRECRDTLTLLAKQLESTHLQFETLQKLKSNKKRRSAWMDYHQKWTNMENKLHEAFRKWTPETLKTGYFYGEIYKEVLDTEFKINKMHQLEHNWMDEKIQSKSNLAYINSATSAAGATVGQLRFKIQEVEKSLLNSATLPKREVR